MADCDRCMFYGYDEEAEGYFCDANIDEDDIARLNMSANKECPYYRPYDEYSVVKHQM